jgi:hypothetical protein
MGGGRGRQERAPRLWNSGGAAESGSDLAGGAEAVGDANEQQPPPWMVKTEAPSWSPIETFAHDK